MAEKGGEKEYEIEILNRSEVVTFPRLGEARPVVIVTYAAAGLPPASVTIPKEEYSKEKEIEVIKEDLKKRLKFKSETYKVKL